MEKERISGRQLLFIMISFEIGSTVLFGLGVEAKQDAWLAMLLAMLCGLSFMWMYTQLTEYYPNHSLIQMIPKIVGTYAGYLLSILYIVFFAYEASRVLRDFGELIVQTILLGTPHLVVMAGFMVSIVYCLRGGLETFGRMAEMMFPVAFLAIVLGWIFISASQLPHPENLSPILEGGIRPVIKAAFPLIVVFPFCQTLLFLMFFSSLHDRRHIRKVGMLAIGISGALLTCNILGLIAVFGSAVLSKIQYPLYTAIGMVRLGDFISNLDAVAILMMVLGGFYKIGAFMYGAVLGTAQLFKLESYHALILPWGAIITAMSAIIAQNNPEHLYIGLKISIPYLGVPFYLVLPVLLLAIAFVRHKHGASKMK